MNLLFISISVLILLIVIIAAAKPIIAGIKAKSEFNEEKKNEKEKEENISQDEEILDKLKDKNLSEEDLKKLYEEIKNKDKEEK
tara:strand:+ start:627 stop:878 length:252 start_codon:yes stop_codon:yes gene_type:complete